MDRPFQMTCMSSASLAAGQGLLAIYSDEVLAESSSYNKAKESIEDFKSTLNLLPSCVIPYTHANTLNQKVMRLCLTLSHG
jgi:hypothetical protein